MFKCVLSVNSMEKNNRNHKNKLLTILLTLFILLYFSHVFPVYAIDIFDTYNNIKTTFEGLSRFLDAIYSFITAISDILGYRALALFFAIAITSAGLSAIGLPKGKISFFISMVIINLLWYTWNKSFEIDWTYTLITMLKTNGIIVFPYILFLLIKHYREIIIRYLTKIFHLIVPFIKRRGIPKQLFHESVKSLNIAYTSVTDSLMNDYFKGETSIKLSTESIRAIEQLENVLQKLKESGWRK